ncbi:MAG: hypothetical protein CVU41_18655 [Chloroflexi bacterium HGW-Chloroflexi-3]|nr:MAG: hypothetical protein CVU41_18655 [Chloroflexi bacterium HGW-Chloroflexi-3]
MFAFLDFCRKTEKSLSEFFKVLPKLPNDPTNHNSLRLYFIMNFLQKFIPTTIDIGAGEIIDFTGRKSSMQDIILYRSNYPVFTTSDIHDTYLLEGVIATIEILPHGDLLQLRQRFINSASVKNLKPSKHNISANNSQDYMELKLRTMPKTFIFSPFNLVNQDAFVKSYQIAKKGTSGVVPDGIFIQGDPGNYAQYDPYTRKTAFLTEDPFIHFFEHLYTIIMAEVKPTMLLPEISAAMNYDFSSYFSDFMRQSIQNQ